MYYFLPANQPLARDIYLKYDHEHYDAIVWKDTDPIDEQTKKFFAEQGVFFQHHLPSSPITSHPQTETDTQQSKRPTVEDLGPDDSEDEINHRNSPVESPFKVPLVSDNYPELLYFNLFRNSTCLKRNTVELKILFFIMKRIQTVPFTENTI